MIYLPYGYGLTVDGQALIMGEIKKDKKGKEYLYQACYPFNLKNALEILLKKKQYEIIKNEDLTLEQALEKFETLQKEFEQVLQDTISKRINIGEDK